MLRKFHVDDAGRLRSGWPNDADSTTGPDRVTGSNTIPPSADAGARSERPQEPPDMNTLIRQGAFNFGSRWP